MRFILSLFVLVAFPAQGQDDKRCTNLLECELACPEVSVQGQRKAPDGRAVTFCDPVGEEVVWHDDNTRASQGERYGEHRTGAWRFWYRNGKLESHRNFADTGLPHGKQEFWFENGKKKGEGSYDEGVSHGTFHDWHPNGAKAGTRQYKQGNLVGTIEQWHSNSRLAARGQVDGRTITWERYYTTGKIGLKGRVEASGDVLDLGDHTRPVGEWTLFFPSGKKQLLAQFRGGRPDGKYERWFSNGKPLFRTEFYRGRERGEQKRWFANGQLETAQTFGKDGRGSPHGVFERFYPSGSLAEKGKYRSGRRHGTWQSWHRNGERAELRRYKGKSAQTQRFDRFGTKLEEGLLTNERRSGTWTHYDAAGVKRSQGDYQRGIKVGTWRYWGLDSKPRAKGNHAPTGRRIGPWRYDHPGGGKQMLVKPLKAKGKAEDARYLHRGRHIPACEKMAVNGSCHGISFFDKHNRLRMRVTLPADWQDAADKACASARQRTDRHCHADHGDLLHAFDGLARLVSRRRVTHPAECWTAGGESEPCPELDENLFPQQGLNSVMKSPAREAENPFASCSDQASCTRICQTWAKANDPFAANVKATRANNELSCSPSGPFIRFHRAKAGIASVVGTRILPHRRALKAEPHGARAIYHPNGTLAEQGSYRYGFKEGLWTQWFENGTKAAEFTFAKGLEKGAAKHWHPEGKLAAIGSYKDGSRTGAWRFFDDAGQPISKGAFRGGRRHGHWLLYDPDGKPESKGKYKQGRMIGRWTYFDTKGRKKATCTWRHDGELDRQDCRRNNGTPIRQGALRDGFEEGPWVFFHRNGKKRAEGTMRQGQRHGVWRLRHPSGAKRAKGSYDQGQRRDDWRCWDADGRRESCPKNI